MDTQPKSQILVCAPSNAATDLIATRLINVGHYKPRQLIRLNAPSRGYDELPPSLRDYSPTIISEGKKHFETPPGDRLKEFRVVICTCYYASIPRAAEVEDHFTHIFVDEAGHAAESEIMVPILQNANSSTNIIVSGDVSAFCNAFVCWLTYHVCAFSRCNWAQLFSLRPASSVIWILAFWNAW